MSDASTTLQKGAAEFVGIFVLVFFGCGTAVMSGGNYVATGLAFGLAVLVMAYAVGRITGGHFNPAVTIGAVLGGRLPWSQVGVYIGAQLVGAIAAGLSLFILLQGLRGLRRRGQHGSERLRRRERQRVCLVGGVPARDPDDAVAVARQQARPSRSSDPWDSCGSTWWMVQASR